MTLNFLEWLAFAILGLALLLGLLRFLLGPSTGDRIVAADTLGVITISGLAGLAWVLQSPLYLDVALVYGVLAFVGVIALARAIEGNRS
jgi:multisubunit Na+/H+ antiporter MnhF subunit